MPGWSEMGGQQYFEKGKILGAMVDQESVRNSTTHCPDAKRGVLDRGKNEGAFTVPYLLLSGR